MSTTTRKIELTQKKVDQHHRHQLQLMRLLALRLTKLAEQEKPHFLADHLQASLNHYQQAEESKKQQFL